MVDKEYMSIPETLLDRNIARLSFRLPLERVDEFGAIYAREFEPILTGYGLTIVDEAVVSPLNDVFARLFAVESPGALEEIRHELAVDPDWCERLSNWGAAFDRMSPEGQLPYALELFIAQAGAGREVAHMPARGTWRNYGAADGLVTSFVRKIVQDDAGQLWFATYGGGVFRYDGREFHAYTTRDGLVHNEVWDVFIDRAGQLWCATEGGVSRYDGERFENFTTADGLVHDEVSSIIQDRNGIIWFGTEGGISRWDGERFDNLTEADGLADNRVAVVYEDRDGILWLGTEGGASRYNGRIFTTFTTREGLGDNWIHDIFQDRDGALWLATNEGGVSRFDGQEFTTLTEADGLVSDGMLTVNQDGEGRMWFGTYRGVSCYDGVSFTNFTEADGLAGNRVWSILEDREGLMWFGTFGGVSRYDVRTFASFRVEDERLDNGVMALTQDGSGRLWFGPWGGGLACKDGDRFTVFTTADGLPDEVILWAMKDGHDRLWFSTWQSGASCYDGTRFINFSEIDGLAGNQIWSMCEDSQGRIWFATYAGASCYDGERFTNWTTADGLAHNRVRHIAEDRHGAIWIATLGGVSRFDGERFATFTEADGLASNSVWSVFEDRQGHMLFSTSGGGVSRFDGEHFATFTRADGLGSDNMWTIYEDSRGYLWFGTSGAGAGRWDGQVFQNLTAEDGLAGDMIRCFCEDADGTLWLGTNNGLTRYRPNMPFPPPIVVDAVVAGRRHQGETGLEVPHSAGLVALEFHGQSFKTRPEAMVFRYRLLGCQDEWQTVRGQRVEYQDLDLGEYTFEIVAVDRDLVYSRAPARLEFRVVPDERDEQIDELEREVRERTRLLVQAEKMAALGNLVAGIAHELNNPAGALGGAHDILDRLIDRIAKVLDADAGENGELLRLLHLLRDNNRNAIGAAKRITQVVQSLKNFARLDEADYQKADIREGLESTLVLLEHEFKDRVEVVRAFAEVPAIYCYPSELNQVFINVLSNAAQHIDGPGRIHIETKADESIVYVRISDTGLGIPAENLERIFDPGFTTQGVGVGTGLGSSTSYNIVQRHKGRIFVESEVGKGSTFTVELPRRE